jgi:sugar phosphate isomerase/epimerase
MKKLVSALPFQISAPSMVFGEDRLKNVRILGGLVDNVEIVLFFTPSLHNIPDHREIEILKEIGEKKNVTFTVHLPASLEIASSEKRKREESVQLAMELCLKFEDLNPKHYVLHVPFSPPTLVPVPGLYFKPGQGHEWDEWTERASESLELLHGVLVDAQRLLVENINYSPYFLDPFLKEGYCMLCLDLGHLMLGRENVIGLMERYLNVTTEIHIHGVEGDREHLSLGVLPGDKVQKWLTYLTETHFNGILNVEVFSPTDLQESMEIILNAKGRDSL